MNKYFNIISITTVIINLVILIIVNNVVTEQNKMNLQMDVAYNAEKLNLVIDKVIERKIIEDSYFQYINNTELIEDIKNYNKQTSEMIHGYTEHSVAILSEYYNIDKSDFTQEMKDIAQRITKYALYKNATELITSDYEIAQLISQDSGGSYGVWPWHIHWECNTGTSIMSSEEIEDYFIFIDEIIKELKIYIAEF